MSCDNYWLAFLIPVMEEQGSCPQGSNNLNRLLSLLGKGSLAWNTFDVLLNSIFGGGRDFRRGGRLFRLQPHHQLRIPVALAAQSLKLLTQLSGLNPKHGVPGRDHGVEECHVLKQGWRLGCRFEDPVLRLTL